MCSLGLAYRADSGRADVQGLNICSQDEEQTSAAAEVYESNMVFISVLWRASDGFDVSDYQRRGGGGCSAM